MEIYLDHASTTPLSESVIEAVTSSMVSCYGNPSSLHRMGMKAEKEVKKAKEGVAKLIKCSEREVVFTSGGTEANNLAIKGLIGNRKGRIITSAIEHPSVLGPIEFLESKGCEVIYIPVNSQGIVEAGEVLKALTPDTLLVSIMHVNNEVGSIQPIEDIAKGIKKYNLKNNTDIKCHVDAIQSFGKIPLDMSVTPIDLLSFSGHKINGLKGTGGLFVRGKIDLKPLLHGGQQENAIRPGTENVLGLIALSKAIEEKASQMEKRFHEVETFRNVMIERFSAYDFFKINGEGSPYILNVSIIGTKGEVMLHSLEMDSIYVSTGSACSSKKKNQSHVLKAMKLSDSEIDGAIRISFGLGLTEEEVIAAAETIIEKGIEIRSIINKKGKRKNG